MRSKDKELRRVVLFERRPSGLTKAHAPRTSTLAMRSGFICGAVAPLQFRPASENHRIFLVRNFISAYGLGVLYS